MLSWRNLGKCFFWNPVSSKFIKYTLSKNAISNSADVVFMPKNSRLKSLWKAFVSFCIDISGYSEFGVRKQSETVDTVLWAVLSITKMTTQRSGLLLSHSGSFRSVISGNLFCCFLLQILAFLAILSNLLSTSLVYGNDPFLYKVLLVFSQLGSSTNKYYRKQGDKEFYHQSLLRFYGVIFPCS